MSTDLQSSRLRRFFRSWWTRGALLTLAFCAGGYFFNEWKWERRWQAYVTDAHARGVKVYITEYLPAEPIPDAENFAATPLWKEVFAQNGKGPRATKLGTAKRGSRKKKVPVPKDRPAPTDLGLFRIGLLNAGQITKADESLSDAEAVLKGLKFVEPDIAEITEALLRPKVNYPVKWEEGFTAGMPHLTICQNLGKILEARACAKVTLGDGDGAFSDIQALTAFARTLENEPSLISCLVEYSLIGMALRSAAQGSDRKLWTDAQLRSFEAVLSEMNMIGRQVFALKSEQAWLNTSMDSFVQNVNIRTFSKIGFGGTFGKTDVLMGAYTNRKSFWRENLLWMSRRSDEEQTMWDPENQRWNPREREFSEEALSGFWQELNLGVASMVGGVFENFAKTSLHLHARVRMAGLACALERHRIAKGAYPDALDALIPEFLPKLPHDPCDGQPFRYRLNEEGYLLYSIGTDRVDDSGKVEDFTNAPSDGPDWRWWSPVLPES